MQFHIFLSDLLMKLKYENDKKVDCSCLPPCDDVNYVLDSENTMDSW